MSENIIVSIYCLAYNHEKYIKDALEGFVSQITDFKYEVFVHDDASKDGTATIIKEYGEKYPEIIKPILQKENQYSKGVRILRDIILPLMSGKYIAVCEGDDFWMDNRKLQKQVDFLNLHPEYVACVHNTKRLFMNSRYEEIMYPSGDREINLEDVSMRGSAAYHTSSLMYRSIYSKEQPLFLTMIKNVGDYPLSIYLALSGKIMFLGEVMSVYRYDTESSWTISTNKNNNSIQNIYRDGIEMLKSADQYSEFKQHKIFCKAIGYQEYQLCKQNGTRLSYIKENYYDYYIKEKFKEKVKMWLHYRLPFFDPIISRVANFIKKVKK